MVKYNVTNNELTIYDYFNYPIFEIDFITSQIKQENSNLNILEDIEYLNNVWATYNLLYVLYLYTTGNNKLIIKKTNSKFKKALFKICANIYAIIF